MREGVINERRQEHSKTSGKPLDRGDRAGMKRGRVGREGVHMKKMKPEWESETCIIKGEI